MTIKYNKKDYKNKLKKILTRKEFIDYNEDIEKLIDFGYDYLEQKNYKKAFQIFCAGFRFDEMNLDILNGLGITLFDLGRCKSSKLLFKKAISLYPEDAVALANLAGVYWEEYDFDRAMHLYYRSLKKDPSIIETHLNLIDLYYEIGDFFMAYIACLNLLDKYPSNDQAIKLRDDIMINMAISI